MGMFSIKYRMGDLHSAIEIFKRIPPLQWKDQVIMLNII